MLSDADTAQKYNIKDRIINKKPFIISYIKTLCLFLAGFLIIQTLCNIVNEIKRFYGWGILVWFDYVIWPIVVFTLIFVLCRVLGVHNMYIGLKSALTTTLLIHIIYILIIYSRPWNVNIADTFTHDIPFADNQIWLPRNNTSSFIIGWIYYMIDAFSARCFYMFAPMVVYIVVKAKQAKSQNVDEIES